MRRANLLTGLAGKTRRTFYVGRAPVVWQRAFARQVRWLGPARRVCNWAIEWRHLPGQLTSQPLLGTEQSNLMDHWDMDRQPMVVPKRSTERGHSFSPGPQAPKANVTSIRSLALPLEQTDIPPVESLKPRPQTLTPKANEALLQRWATSSNEDLGNIAKSSTPFSKETDARRRSLEKRYPDTQEQLPKQQPIEQSSKAVARVSPSSKEAHQGWLTRLKRNVYDGLDRSIVPLPLSSSAEGKETGLLKQKNLESDFVRSQPPGLGQRVSRDFLTHLLAFSHPSPLMGKAPSQPSRPTSPDTPSVGSTRQPYSDHFSNITKPGIVSDATANFVKATKPAKDTFASDFTPGEIYRLTPLPDHTSAPTSPQVIEPGLAMPEPLPERLEPMAASLPESPLPDLRSLSTPGPTPTPERQPNHPRTPVPTDEDLSLLAGKLQQILDTEARRHGINI